MVLWLSLFGYKALKLYFVKFIWGPITHLSEEQINCQSSSTGTLPVFCVHVNLKDIFDRQEQFFFFVLRRLVLYPDVFCQHPRFCGKHLKNVTFWTPIMRRLTAEALLAAQNVLLIFQPLWETRLDIINVLRRYEKMALHAVAKKKDLKACTII